jgi:hypothetical protein
MPDHVRRQLEDYMAGPDVSRARMLTREVHAHAHDTTRHAWHHTQRVFGRLTGRSFWLV